MKKIAMFGICGRMGKAISAGLIKEDDIKLVAGFDSINNGIDIGEFLGGDTMGVKITDSYEDIKNARPGYNNRLYHCRHCRKDHRVGNR